jgi:predicted nucleotidyltransferase
VSSSALAWGDYDNDGDLDILLAGWTGSSRTSRVYRNDGASTFTDIGAPLVGVSDGTASWSDYDRDGDLDILLTGFFGPPVASPPKATRLYRNDAGTFVEVASTGLPDVAYSAAAWGDFDNDGDLDLALTGWQSAGSYVASVYRNGGGGTFSDINAGLTPVLYGAVAWGDYDNDADLDILLTGDTGLLSSVTRIYRNNGDATFTDIVAGLAGVKNGSVAWGDANNDGDLDILLTGRQPSFPNDLLLLWLYSNTGSGTFPGSGVGGTEYGSVSWADYDNDGDLDFLLTGSTTISLEARLYRNDGATFVDSSAGLIGVGRSAAAWGDYDNDGDLDLLVSGYRNGVDSTWLYRNNAAAANSAPGAPAGLAASVASSDQVTLSWAAAADAQSPPAALTYNLRVGTTPGGTEISSPMASTATGYRRLPAMGGAQLGNSATLKSLPSGTYYWSVQAVDTAFAGSPFAGEQTFSIGTVNPTGQRFFTLDPCRVVDTRASDGPAVAGDTTRTFVLAGKCGIPNSARALSVNVTVTGPTGAGDLRLFPAGVNLPLVSAINYTAGQTRANNAVVGLGAGGAVGVWCDQASGTVEVIIDVNGYFE